MHPSEGIRCAKSCALKGRRIVLGITGSIAAVESFELARELIRHGADVHAVMSGEGEKLVTPAAMEFATGNEVVTELDGRAQHIQFFGDYPGRADLLLVSPCTANTLSKMALGIDDTPVTTMATVAIGSKVPVIAAPAMHLSMYEHPIVQKNLGTLRDIGVILVGPHFSGKKARIASVEEITEAAITALGRNDLKAKRVLVIGGSSEEPIDDVRVVTNNTTGESAVLLAQAARERGAEVEMWNGRMAFPVPGHIAQRRFRTVKDLLEMVPEIDHDIVLVPAALSDYAPVRTKGKVASGKKELTLKLAGLPKVLPTIRQKASKVVGFKAEVGVSEKELVRRARGRLDEHGLDLIVANDLRNVAPGRTRAFLVRKDGGEVPFEGSKRELADVILDEVLR